MASKLGERRCAFTLIEVLVVVAIIALLISILLPSLTKAKSEAAAVVCSSQLAQAQRAEATYESTSRGWVVGSPLTTGYFLTKNGSWDPSLPGFTRIALDMFDFSTPLRVQMYGISSIPGANSSNATAARKHSYLKVTDEPFLCPANPEMAPPWPANSGFPVIHATSYLSMWTLMRGGSSVYRQAASQFPAVAPSNVGQSDSWEMKVPSTYMPHADRIGRSSMKVFLADGLRFFSGPPSNTIDYSIDPTAAKGMMSAAPPSTYAPDSPEYAREYGMARMYSYRHGNKDRMNAVFFDGHVDKLIARPKGEGQPFTGSAVHPKHYYPSKTVVNDPSALHVPIPAGTELP